MKNVEKFKTCLGREQKIPDFLSGIFFASDAGGSKFLCFRQDEKSAAMFCRPNRRQNGRAGVESTYLELERSEQF